ncbi:MAG: oligosaccharide flippase family protein, partial [Clostridiales bacterium]|nr:oligosaccharide flippase family protein [Clostridiales bacterium]
MSENKYKYLAKNTAVFAISSFGSKLLVFLLVPFYTRVLSTEEYGSVDLVTTTSSLLTFVVTICIADAVIRFAIDGVSSRYGVFRFGIEVVSFGSLIFALILFVVRSIHIFDLEDYYYLFLFAILYTGAISQVISNYLRAIDRVKDVGVMGILVTLFTIVSNLLLLLVFKLGVVGFLLSNVIGHLIPAFYGFYIIYRYDRACFSQICSKETKRQMVMYSLPLIFNGLAWWANSCLDRYFIVFYFSAAVNGVYAVASKIPTILNTINQIFSQAWNLSAIKEYDGEDKSGFFGGIYSLYNFILVSGCSFLILLNIPLAKILFAKEFFEAWNYSSLLLISTVFSAMSSILGSVFVAVKNSKIFAYSTVVAAGLNALFNWILIPIYGALGAAIATVISFFAIWLIRYICVVRYIKLRINIVRDVFSYVLLVSQSVLEHIGNHNYYLQSLVFIVILLLYKTEISNGLSKTNR